MGDAILITGASGFVGTAVCRRLATAGNTIRAVSRNPATIADASLEAVGMPSPGSGKEAWIPLLDGVDHVVHCAGMAHATDDVPEATYHAVNAVLTGEIAAAAADRIPGKFVFMSSIRAVCGPVSAEIVTDRTEPAPQDAYGRSKREGEQLVRAAFGQSGRFTILRPVLVHGPGVKGNLAELLRLARSPVPLPFAGLSAKRSLLDLESCAAAVEHVLRSAHTDGTAFLVSDRNPVSIPEIMAALRRGLGRRPGTFSLPEPVLAGLFAAAGQTEAWRRLSGPLVADSSPLEATGWHPVDNSLERLERLARATMLADERPKLR